MTPSADLNGLVRFAERRSLFLRMFHHISNAVYHLGKTYISASYKTMFVLYQYAPKSNLCDKLLMQSSSTKSKATEWRHKELLLLYNVCALCKVSQYTNINSGTAKQNKSNSYVHLFTYVLYKPTTQSED